MKLRKRLSLLFLWLGFPTAMFAGVADSNTYVPSNYYAFQPPGVGGTYTDADFGTSIKRISNALGTPNKDQGGNLTFITDDYSTMTPFNRDNSRILLVHQSYFALYDGSGNLLKSLPLEIHAQSEPRWSRSDANVFYYVRGNQLKQYNVTTDAMSVVHTFSEYSSITGKGESDICFDGKHFVFAGDNRYVFVYEISTDSKGPVFDTGGRGFDSLYITPDDNVSITWLEDGTGRYTGIELFSRDMNFLRQLTRSGGHMDYTRDSNGDEVLIWPNSTDPSPSEPVPGGNVTLDLPSNGHLARYVEELFPQVDLRAFRGTLTVAAQGGGIVGTALQLGEKQGDLTALPVTELR